MRVACCTRVPHLKHFSKQQTKLQTANSGGTPFTTRCVQGACIPACNWTGGGVSQRAMGQGCLPGHFCLVGVCLGGVYHTPSSPSTRTTPPPETAIEVGGTHPTGMHSCNHFKIQNFKSNLREQKLQKSFLKIISKTNYTKLIFPKTVK